jgi:hypothetical protein
VSLKSRLRTLLCCVVLELGALTGVPMRPDEIEELMNTLAQPKLARTNPDKPDEGDLPASADADVRIRRGWRLLPRPPGGSAASTRPTTRWWRRWRMF